MIEIVKAWILLLFPVLVFAQRHEAGIVLENDLFTSTVNDKYYTNGIELLYRFASKRKTSSTLKSTNEFRIGQYIYNPQTVQAADPNFHDRPFAGVLSGQYIKGWFYNSGSMLKVGATAGIIGPESGAEATQKLIHNTFGYKRVAGWAYQIRTTPVIGLRANFLQHIWASENVDLGIQGEAFGGTAFSGVSAGFVSRIGIFDLLPRHQSIMYGAAVGNDVSVPQKELFIYVAPGIQYQFYDATIQGSAFNDHSPIVWDLVPMRIVGEAGIKYRTGNLCMSYAFIYRGKEADNWVNIGYYYGSISASWLFK
ncbi:MAG: lipid A deacylase LpxR family protein [Chitinophagaceae bacterium]|nr:MAG: lipid A deacylase LpxR family protein [Chitinophagaceae bacterium]